MGVLGPHTNWPYCRSHSQGNLELAHWDIRFLAAVRVLSMFFKELVVLDLLADTNGSADQILNPYSKVEIHTFKHAPDVGGM